ncbi:MAG TPA: HXXEE domain-containing protein [Pyrinomonadaceae bacterium]|nr:HXXEE domain-containing protein [Pyrinomonadaceae bacterium]
MRAGIELSVERWPSLWGWLFPATYALHILEELWGGVGFTAWLGRVAGVQLETRQFFIWNALALLLMAVGVVLAGRFKHLRWLLLAYAVAFTLNALTHLAASLYTVSYSPGLVSGLLLWLPLGAHALLGYRKTLSRRGRRAGLFVGLLMHAAVLALTLWGGRLNF